MRSEILLLVLASWFLHKGPISKRLSASLCLTKFRLHLNHNYLHWHVFLGQIHDIIVQYSLQSLHKRFWAIAAIQSVICQGSGSRALCRTHIDGFDSLTVLAVLSRSWVDSGFSVANICASYQNSAKNRQKVLQIKQVNLAN